MVERSFLTQGRLILSLIGLRSRVRVVMETELSGEICDAFDLVVFFIQLQLALVLVFRSLRVRVKDG